MRKMAAAGAKNACASMLAYILLAPSMQAPARCEARPDSSISYRWSAVYGSLIDIDRGSSFFPWNDEETLSHINDRLALLGEIVQGDGFSLFAKGSTGFRLGGEYQEQRYVLEQGHVAFDIFDGAVRGRLFSHERVYRTDQELIKLISDESQFVAGRGEGLAVEVNAGANVSASFIGSIFRDDITDHGGLPSFYGGGDVLRMFRIEGFQKPRWHAGLTLSEVRSLTFGDRITVGADAGLHVRGLDFLTELARVRSGGWDELRNGSLFDLRLREAKLDDPVSIFSTNNAFSFEIEGLELGIGGLGAVGIVPSYRFNGESFTELEGEISPGLSESSVLAWWQPASYDALVSIDASDGEYRGRDFSNLIGSARMRYRGGFEIKESVLCRTGERSSGVVSFIDDNERSRVAVSARLDDLGAGNALSYLAHAGLNLGSRVTARGALYLCRSNQSLYNVQLEFRPRGRFLLRAVMGSFTPRYEGLMLDNEFDPYQPSKDRFVYLFTRIWFGAEGEK
ncbi:MAG: hypothetical protein PHD74_03730 [Candidatus Krumholzibacteria bacterium]|nr:hypothetical protein [Candidatus Krumholzibacteria bacterium]